MFRSLSAKFNFAIALVLVTVLGVSAFFTLNEQNRQAEENTKAKALLLTQTVTNIIRMDMETPGEKDLDKLIRVVGQFQDIETLRIFGVDGQILHSADEAEEGRGIDDLVMNVFLSGDKTKPFRSGDEGHRSMCRVEVVYNEATCHQCHDPNEEIIGVLEVCLSMAAMDTQISRNARFMVGSTLVTILVVAVAISLLTAGMVTRPISFLMRVMRQAQAGDMNVRARSRQKDELGRLGHSFNEMISRVDEANQEVERLHKEQMSRAERLASIGEMSASVAHEIKNPLAGLSGATQILSKSFAEDDERRQVIDEMLKLTGRLDKTINDLLSFARVSTPAWQIVNPNDVVRETLFFAQRDRKSDTCELLEHLDEGMPKIPLDPQQIQQVLLNLVINAQHACTEHGRVIVGTFREPTGPLPEGHDPTDFVEISVADNGMGITAQARADIFKPFFTTKVQGTGLGLPISRNIVEAHGGHMGCTSIAGEGTTFYVWLRKSVETT